MKQGWRRHRNVLILKKNNIFIVGFFLLLSLLTEKEQEPKLTCEYCGWVDFAYTFKGSKRFCSVVCAKRQVTCLDWHVFLCVLNVMEQLERRTSLHRYNVGCTKRIGLFRPERTKPTSRWRRKSQSRSSIEPKKQVEKLTHTSFPF